MAEEETKPAPTAGGGGNQDNSMAMLAHILGLLTSFVGPLVLYLAYKDAKPYIQAQVKEALNFQIMIAIAYVAASILMIIGIGALIWAAAGIVNLIFCIMAAIAASKGENYRYPFSLRLVK